jgi:hypothetical protein
VTEVLESGERPVGGAAQVEAPVEATGVVDLGDYEYNRPRYRPSPRIYAAWRKSNGAVPEGALVDASGRFGGLRGDASHRSGTGGNQSATEEAPVEAQGSLF